MFMVVVVMTMVFIDIIKTSKSSHLDGRNSFESQHQHEWWWWQWWFWIERPYSSKHQGQVTLVGGTLLKVQVVATFCPTAYLSAIHFLLIFPLICCLVKTLKVTTSLSAASAFSSWSAWSASPTLRRWSWPGIHWSAQRWLIRASSSSHTFKERETSSICSNISLASLNHWNFPFIPSPSCSGHQAGPSPEAKR